MTPWDQNKPLCPVCFLREHIEMMMEMQCEEDEPIIRALQSAADFVLRRPDKEQIALMLLETWAGRNNLQYQHH